VLQYFTSGWNNILYTCLYMCLQVLTPKLYVLMCVRFSFVQFIHKFPMGSPSFGLIFIDCFWDTEIFHPSQSFQSTYSLILLFISDIHSSFLVCTYEQAVRVQSFLASQFPNLETKLLMPIYSIFYIQGVPGPACTKHKDYNYPAFIGLVWT
jgi:hypothetical protein